MTTDTVLSIEELTQTVLADKVLQYHFALNGGAGPVSVKGVKIFRAIEQAVLQSEQVQAWKRDAGLWQRSLEEKKEQP